MMDTESFFFAFRWWQQTWMALSTTYCATPSSVATPCSSSPSTLAVAPSLSALRWIVSRFEPRRTDSSTLNQSKTHVAFVFCCAADASLLADSAGDGRRQPAVVVGGPGHHHRHRHQRQPAPLLSGQPQPGAAGTEALIHGVVEAGSEARSPPGLGSVSVRLGLHLCFELQVPVIFCFI